MSPSPDDFYFFPDMKLWPELQPPADPFPVTSKALDGLWLSPRRYAQQVWKDLGEVKNLEVHVDHHMPEDRGFVFYGGKMIAVLEFEPFPPPAPPEANGHTIIKAGLFARMKRALSGRADG